MSKKMEFAKRVTESGAKLAALCREFGISRQTGHKWRKRYLELGVDGLEEESRRPKASPLSLAEELVLAVVAARDAHPTWGPKKLHVLLRRKFGDKTPSTATVARILRRVGRIQKRRRRAPMCVVEAAPNVSATKPNELWTVDFKGWWKTQDGSRCEPLTVRDAFSRFVFTVTLTSTTVEAVRDIFERLFRKHGLPDAIQCDNGSPFANATARGGLTRLSAWWVSLGIRVVRSRPGCPQDNGAHERMHRDIAAEIEKAPALSLAAQQRILDGWRVEFNHVRPHEALGGKTPVELYAKSERRYRKPLVPVYPPHFIVKVVARHGAFCLDGEPYFVSVTLGCQAIGLEQLDEVRWRVWFHHLDCGELEMLPQALSSFVPPLTPRPSNGLERHDARRRVMRVRAKGHPAHRTGRDAHHPPSEPKEDSSAA
jgi:transposase InsO family protein